MDQFKQREKMTGHAVCSPSQLYRILTCPGSVFESIKAPISEPSSYAQHGTKLHDIIANLLTKKPGAKVAFEQLELSDKNMIEDCLDYGKDVWENTTQDCVIRVENSVSLESWGLDNIWGTLDFMIDDSRDRVLHVLDWKFGAGVKIWAKDNEQMLAYAAGILGFPADAGYTIFLHVGQPALNHFDVHELKYNQLTQWVFDVLTPGIEAAIVPEDKPYHPGEKQCRFCPAAMTCRARLEESRKTAADIFRIHSNLAIATKDELADVLKRIRSVNKYATQIEAYASAELTQGRVFPGYKMVAGRALRKWVDEKKVGAWLLGNSAVNEEDMFTKKFISPAQAEKLDRHLKKSSDFAKFVTKPAGKPKLVTEDDPRPAIEPDKEAAKAFEGWQDEGE